MNNTNLDEILDSQSNSYSEIENQKHQNATNRMAGHVAELVNFDPESDLSSFSHDELSDLVVKAYRRIVELDALESANSDKHNRLLADFANYKARVSREIQFAVTMSEKRLLLEFLPIVDNLERCLALTYVNIDDLNSGVSLIHKQLLEVLRKVGVEGVEINVGDLFDAQHAEALTTVTVPDLPDGVVANVFERGFMLRDYLLRPARVIVNQKLVEE